MNSNKKYAVFIDGDNISPSYLKAIFDELSKNGDILIRRVYGDWTTSNMNGWKGLLLQIPVRPIQQFRNGSQVTDFAIIMDTIELVNTNKEVNAVCIVSSDADYSSLALKIREYGLFVLGIGAQKSSQLWIESCNQFKYLENLSDDKTQKNVVAENKNEVISPITLQDLLARAYADSQKDNANWVVLSHLSSSIRKIMPDFKPNKFNHKTLSKLISSMPKLYKLDRDNLNNYRVKKI